jgi:hypothetical protein
MMPTNTLYIVVGVLALLAIALFVISYFCFNDEDPDMDWYDNYAVAERPHIEPSPSPSPCKHTGEKSLVCEWTVCGCEKVNTYCDACGAMIKEGYVEC